MSWNELNDVSNTLNEFSYELTYGLGEDLIDMEHSLRI